MLEFLLGILPVALLVIVVLIVVIGLFKASWRVAEPNEALIISGRNKADGAATAAGADESMKFRIITGVGTLVIPGIETVRRLDLNLIETNLTIKCRTKQGIDVNIEGSPYGSLSSLNSAKSLTLTNTSLTSSPIATTPLVTVQPSIFWRCLSFIAAIFADVSFTTVCLVSITDPPSNS